MSKPDIIHAVGIVVIKGDEVLMVKRAKAPNPGAWSIPGGQIETGESEVDAARRELLEETALNVGKLVKIETVIADFSGTVYHLHDYAANYSGGHVIAGDDAVDARFMSAAELAQHPIWDRTLDIIHKAKAMLSVSKTGDAS